MQQPAAVAWRAALILIAALGIAAAGVLTDALAGTSPLATLIALVLAVIWGTIMLLVIVLSSFPKPTNEQRPDITRDDSRGD